MAEEHGLSSVLSEFARTLITDFSIQEILDHLVLRIAEVLPISSAGVTLMAADVAPHLVAASDEFAMRCEHVQIDAASGPCRTAFETGEAVSIPDVEVDTAFPAFSPAALEAGLRAVFTFPLRHGTGCIGALDLYRHTSGQLDSAEMEIAQTLSDVVAAYVLNARARDDARVAAALLSHSALHDQLTGLPNRHLLADRLAHAAARARRSESSSAVLFADLDRFKEINDGHGHHVGDALLVAVADRLSNVIRAEDTLVRFSGDEFVVLCEDLVEVTDAELLAVRIGACFDEPFRIADHEFTVTASVGIAFAGPGEEVSEQLIIEADLAMYQMKRRGGAGYRFVDHVGRSVLDVDRLATELWSALSDNSLTVAYQPIVRMADGAVAGVEALLRWHHPTRGPISPIVMVAAAEQSDLIDAVGLWVLERACADHQRWTREVAADPISVAVNVSVRQLDPTFPAQVAAVLARTGTDPTSLVLEITESVLIGSYRQCSGVLAQLRDLGVRIAIDDFGTGYSTLEHLDRLPIDIIKIDRRFVARAESTPCTRSIITFINRLADDLALEVVAEGVETEGQRRAIDLLGCRLAQGYYFARPMPPTEIQQHLDHPFSFDARARATAGLLVTPAPPAGVT